MVDRIRERTRHTGNADLSYPADAERVEIEVGTVDERDVDRLDVRVHGDVIFRKVRIHDPANSHVEDRVLEQRKTHTPYDSALQLAARGLRIQTAADIVRGDDPRHPDFTEVRIDMHFGEDGAERMEGRTLAFGTRLGLGRCLERRRHATRERRERFAPARFVACHEPAAVD